MFKWNAIMSMGQEEQPPSNSSTPNQQVKIQGGVPKT
jgi:hypothetical protein